MVYTKLQIHPKGDITLSFLKKNTWVTKSKVAGFRLESKVTWEGWDTVVCGGHLCCSVFMG